MRFVRALGSARSCSTARIHLSSYEPLPIAVLQLVVAMRNALPDLIVELNARPAAPLGD